MAYTIRVQNERIVKKEPKYFGKFETREEGIKALEICRQALSASGHSIERTHFDIQVLNRFIAYNIFAGSLLFDNAMHSYQLVEDESGA